MIASETLATELVRGSDRRRGVPSAERGAGLPRSSSRCARPEPPASRGERAGSAAAASPRPRRARAGRDPPPRPRSRAATRRSDALAVRAGTARFSARGRAELRPRWSRSSTTISTGETGSTTFLAAAPPRVRAVVPWLLAPPASPRRGPRSGAPARPAASTLRGGFDASARLDARLLGGHRLHVVDVALHQGREMLEELALRVQELRDGGAVGCGASGGRSAGGRDARALPRGRGLGIADDPGGLGPRPLDDPLGLGAGVRGRRRADAR